MELAIETFDLTKSFGALTAVNKLNLQVEAGSIHGFLGPNGAGKTTTIKMLVGLLKPDGGSATVLGQKLGCMHASIPPTPKYEINITS